MLALALGAVAAAAVAVVFVVRNLRNDSLATAGRKTPGRVPSAQAHPDPSGELFRRATLLVPDLLNTGLLRPERPAELNGWLTRYQERPAGLTDAELLAEVAYILLQVETDDKSTFNLELAAPQRKGLETWLNDYYQRKDTKR